jgi:hypothetical protein
MGRLDWKKGRFDTEYEIAQIEGAVRGFQGSQVEDSVEYFRFDKADSSTHDIYDEGFGVGLVFHPSVDLPVLHATHTEGGQGQGENDSGFYYGDTIYVTTSYDIFTRTGMTQADVHHERYLKDRILYDGLIFRVQSINITGQINEQDTMVSIEGTQVKPDEMANDPQFAEYAEQPSPNTP